MKYAEAIDYLYNATPVFEQIGAAAYKPGLNTTQELARHFGNPHTKFASIHIAGTNGKGSCSHSIAAALQTAGYKTGLYTSPHLVDFRERIRINGKCVPETFVTNFVEKFIQWQDTRQNRLYPSFFELTTIMAFSYFAESETDIAVIETGLGGRLDSTNIIVPVLSVITNISYDHQQFLGTTLKEIAGEKAGIIKKNIPVVIGERKEETAAVFEAKAKEECAPLHFADEETTSGDYDFELKGLYQAENLRTTLCALEHLPEQFRIKDTDIRQALTNVCKLTGLQGRWQTIRKEPAVVCDTGHNVAAWQYLALQLTEQECLNMRIVFGMVDDKDINAVMKMLAELRSKSKAQHTEYYFCQATTHRAIPATKVVKYAQQQSIDGKTFTSVKQAYCQALSDSTPADFIFVGGSSYVVADLLTFLQR